MPDQVCQWSLFKDVDKDNISQATAKYLAWYLQIFWRTYWLLSAGLRQAAELLDLCFCIINEGSFGLQFHCQTLGGCVGSLVFRCCWQWWGFFMCLRYGDISGGSWRINVRQLLLLLKLQQFICPFWKCWRCSRWNYVAVDQVDQSQLLWSVSPWYMVTFLRRWTSDYF